MVVNLLRSPLSPLCLARSSSGNRSREPDSIALSPFTVGFSDRARCLMPNPTKRYHLSKGTPTGSKPRVYRILKSTESSSSDTTSDNQNVSSAKSKTPFGYNRKDVLLIGFGVTALGVGLKYGLELAGVDSLQAGNVVQLVLVLGLTIGWISTYIFRVSNKEMTYAQQLKDYESKVMQKRLEGLTEAELEALMEQVEEEKRRVARDGRAN